MVYEPESEFREEIIDGKSWITLIIKDNGIGWSWDDMPPHVREKYLKGKKTIEFLGGSFQYENSPYQGAKVTVKLPSHILGENPKQTLMDIFLRYKKERGL